MTQLDSHARRSLTQPRIPTPTIYRDTLLSPWTTPARSSVRALALPDERVADGLMLGLGALTLPALVYSFFQLCGLVSGGSLEHAVRAFLP